MGDSKHAHSGMKGETMKTLNKKEVQYKAIRKHGEDLNRLFNTELDPIVLCKKLHSIEIRAHKLAEDYCNGLIETSDWEDVSGKVLSQVNNILHYRESGVPVFFNGDPRGYALKIDETWVKNKRNSFGFSPIYQDWGGYGIIAPEFDGRN